MPVKPRQPRRSHRAEPRNSILTMLDPKRYDVRLWSGTFPDLMKHLEKQFALRKNKQERWLMAFRVRGTLFTYSKKFITATNNPSGKFTEDYVRWNAVCYELGFGAETNHWFNA